MPSDWIKMRTDLYRDPKVCKIADILLDPEGPLACYVSQNCQRDMTITRNALRNVTVGALVTLWGVTRHRGKRYEDDLVLRKIDADVIDDIVDIPGFGEAMLAVGWAEVRGEDLVFPRFFEEFNTEPSDDARQKAAERQRKYREKRNALRNVTVTSQSNVREEKSREEKSKDRQRPSAYANVPPSVSDVSRRIQERNLSIDVEEFMAYYDARGWKLKGQQIKDWNACLTTWAKNGKHFSQPVQEENNDPIL